MDYKKAYLHLFAQYATITEHLLEGRFLDAWRVLNKVQKETEEMIMTDANE